MACCRSWWRPCPAPGAPSSSRRGHSRRCNRRRRARRRTRPPPLTPSSGVWGPSVWSPGWRWERATPARTARIWMYRDGGGRRRRIRRGHRRRYRRRRLHPVGRGWLQPNRRLSSLARAEVSRTGVAGPAGVIVSPRPPARVSDARGCAADLHRCGRIPAARCRRPRPGTARRGKPPLSEPAEIEMRRHRPPTSRPAGPGPGPAGATPSSGAGGIRPRLLLVFLVGIVRGSIPSCGAAVGATLPVGSIAAWPVRSAMTGTSAPETGALPPVGCEPAGAASTPPEGQLTCVPVCGDGLLVGDEACDDRNVRSGDGCSHRCFVEDGWECRGEPSACRRLPPRVVVPPAPGRPLTGLTAWELRRLVLDEPTTCADGTPAALSVWPGSGGPPHRPGGRVALFGLRQLLLADQLLRRARGQAPIADGTVATCPASPLGNVTRGNNPASSVPGTTVTSAGPPSTVAIRRTSSGTSPSSTFLCARSTIMPGARSSPIGQARGA